MNNEHNLLKYLPCIISLIIIVVFFVIERLLRQGEAAKTLKSNNYDKLSTFILGFGIVLCIMMIFITIILNHFNIYFINSILLSIIGTVIMIVGLIIRIIAAKSLGKHYTRTLTKIENHKLFTEGIYKYIRNPGYFGDLLVFIGAGITSNNYLSIIICLIITIIIYSYRIKVEESILLEIFGNEFTIYKKRTKRLIPFLY